MAAALAGLSLANSASAQMWGSAGGVTVALTYSYTAPALAAKDDVGKVIPTKDGGGPAYSNSYSVDTIKKIKVDDGDGGFYYEEETTKTVSTEEYGSKIATGKWGNADIIKAMVQMPEGGLPKKGKAPFTAGWSLIVIHGFEDRPKFCAKHTDGTTIDLDIDLVELPAFTLESDGDEGGGEDVPASEARARSRKTIETTYPSDPERESTESFTLTESFKISGWGMVPFFETMTYIPEEGPAEVEVYSSLFEVYGLLTGSGKAVLKTWGTGEEKQSMMLYVPGAIKLDKIVGGSEFGDVIEGSISLGAASVVDLDNYDFTSSSAL